MNRGPARRPGLRKRSEIPQRDPFLRQLIERVESRMSQSDLATKSGVHRGAYVVMRAGSTGTQWRNIAAWLGAAGLRVVIEEETK